MHPSEGSIRPTRKLNLAQGMRDDFRTILRRNPLRAREADALLDQVLAARGFGLEHRKLRVWQAPVILDSGLVRELTRSVRTLSALLEQTTQLALGSVAFMEQLGISPNVEELALHDAPSRLAIEFARYDFLPSPHGPRFLEFNVDSPAGALLSNTLDTEFQKLESAREAGLHTLFPSSPPADLYEDAMLAAYGEHAFAVAESPNVAIVDFAGVNTRPEQEMLAQAVRARGLKAELLDPREFEFRRADRGLYAKDTRWHLVVRRVLAPELARRRVLVSQFLHGLRHGEVVTVNPLRSRLAGNKGVLEILTSQAFDRFFTMAENEQKARLLPWTRRMFERKTDYLDSEIDLVPFVTEKRDRFVLKPGGASGGDDVVIGAFTDAETWRRRIEECLNQDAVVQEYVPPVEHPVPLLEGNEVVEQSRFLVLGAFAIRGEYGGCIARINSDPVVNVRRGGGIVPVLEAGGRSKTGPIEASRPRRRRTTGQTG
ncbi:MAG: glutathionylspermidine synthase family protein [Planctomycetes bacterium]|nr:glutathionylspermidine synthase family protein [Planctomycetota bacterium]